MNRKEKRALKRQKKAIKVIGIMDKFANMAGFTNFEALAYGFGLASPEDIAAVSSLRPIPDETTPSQAEGEAPETEGLTSNIDPEELSREEYAEWQ